MLQVNIHDAKTHLSHLIDKTLSGEEIIIVRHGKPVARLTPYTKPTTKRIPGSLRDKIKISSDFDDPLLDEIDSCGK